MQTVKLQKNNQLTAPAQMCRNNDWQPGDELLVFDLGGAIAYVDPSHFRLIDHFKEMVDAQRSFEVSFLDATQAEEDD